MKRLLGCTLPALLTTLALTGCGSSDGEPKGGGGEANLKLPPLNEQVGNVSGTALLWIGLVICLFGLVFGLVTYSKLQKLPVHEAMHEVSELIYETCKTYLKQQAKFLMLLWAFIAAVIVVYFLFLEHMGAKVLIILLFSLIGMAGSFGVA
ncbi:MAG: sodium/proton-translocating pyrophosphatase, partial [Cutibacterium avidum]|nr:sodium/proton-translocating pyrophosphatase [Cutibacterium avidum]